MQGEWSKPVLPKAEKAYRDGIEVKIICLHMMKNMF